MTEEDRSLADAYVDFTEYVYNTIVVIDWLTFDDFFDWAGIEKKLRNDFAIASILNQVYNNKERTERLRVVKHIRDGK